MNTVCHNRLTGESLFSKAVIADFEGGWITSDAGGVLLRELNQGYRLAEKAVACLHNPRDSGQVKHDLLILAARPGSRQPRPASPWLVLPADLPASTDIPPFRTL